MTAKTLGSNNAGRPPRAPPGEAMTQSDMDVVQALSRVALANHEATIAQLVTPDLVWEILEGFPHSGIYAGIPAIFRPVLPQAPGGFP
jgi:hypothetical protein